MKNNNEDHMFISILLLQKQNEMKNTTLISE